MQRVPLTAWQDRLAPIRIVLYANLANTITTGFRGQIASFVLLESTRPTEVLLLA